MVRGSFMVTVKDIFYHFRQKQNEGKLSSPILDFLKTVPGFNIIHEVKGEIMDMSLAMSIIKICDKMADDMLLMKTKPNTIPILNEYCCVHEANSSDPEHFLRELDYGTYDFMYQGLSYVYQYFKDSVVPIAGIKPNKSEDLGTAYYIGNGCFVTAAHCINNLDKFNILLHDGSRLPITRIAFAKEQNLEEYDLAVIYTDALISYPALWLQEPKVLDDVLTMGYPPVPCFDLIKVAETASVGVIIQGGQKSVVGQVVAPGKSYVSPLDYFLINARVKGGNSGGPVINGEGKVIGTVVEIPFDNAGGSESGRYDIMGFGVCLPSKYVRKLLINPDNKGVVDDGAYYKLVNE